MPDIIDPNKWKPIKGRIYDPNKRSGYVAAVDGLINKVATPGLRAAAKAGSHSKKEERAVLEEMVLARVLGIATRAAKIANGHSNQHTAGFDAIRTAYPGIDTDLDKIFTKHRDTNLGREIYEYADVLIGPLYTGNLAKPDLAKIQQAQNAGQPLAELFTFPGATLPARDLTNKEKEYISTTESPGIPRDLRVQFRTKGIPMSNENRKRIQGPDLALQYKNVKIPDPNNPSVTTTVKLNVLLDAHGRLREDMLFPTSRNPYIQRRAEIFREAFAETFAGNQVFGDTLGLKKKLLEWMDLERHVPGRYRKLLSADKQKKTGIERLYGTEEGKIRRDGIATDIAKKEFAAPLNERIVKYFQGKSPSSYTGEEIAKAVGITDYSKCFVGTEFSGYRAFLLSRGLDPDNPAHAGAIAAEIKRVTDTYYMGYGFGEFRFPIKDEVGVAQPGTQQGMLEYNDTGFRPDQEAAEAFVKDLLDKIGEKMFTGNSYTLGLGMTAETIQGPNGVRVKVTYADGRTLYFDTDNYWDVEARMMSVGEATMLHQQMQALARDPVNFAVAWYYQGVGNAMINMIPGARSAYNSTYRILKQRNSLLPKMDQLSTKAIGDWANLIIKRTLLSPMYVYDPDSNRAVPRYGYLIRSGINWAIDSIAGSELQPGLLDNFLTKTGILGKNEWFWDPIANGGLGGLAKRAWEPRIFKRIMTSRRQKERQSIFDLIIKMSYGVFINMIGARIVNIVARVPLVARSIHGIQRLRAYPMQQINKVWNKLPLNIQNRLATTWNWSKLGWQAGGTALKTAGQALLPAAMAGIVFNSPIAFAVAAVSAGVPLTLMNFATLADTNAFFSSTALGKHFDTLGKLLYKPHAQAAVILTPQSGAFSPLAGNPTKLPKFFGLEHLIYGETTPGSDVWKVRNNYLAKFLSNHANVRGLLKGVNRATYAFTIAYALTGSYVWAAIAAGSTVVLSISTENIIKVISNKLPAIAGKLTGISGVASTVGSLAMGGATLAMGLNFIRGGITAALSGRDEWEKWKNDNFGNAISSSLSVMTVFGVVTSFASIYATGSQLGKLLMKPITNIIRGSSLKFGRWGLGHFGRWAQIGAITGFIIGIIVGGIFGAQLGATLGGTIGGAIGGVFGGMLLGGKIGVFIGSLFSFISFGTSLLIGGILGSIIGGIAGGLGGSLIGVAFEKIVIDRIRGVMQGFNTAFNLIGNAMNVLQAIKLLLSGDLADVGVGALMLCLAGVFTFSAITTSSMTAASHIETEWTKSGEGILGPPGTAAVPTTIKDFSKTTDGFSEDGTTITYRIHVTNTDDENRNIVIHFEDILNTKDLSMQSAISYEILEGGNVNENRSGKTISLKQDEKTLAPGEENALEIKFKIGSRTFPEWIAEMPEEKMCNTGKIVGQIEEGDAIDYTDIICIDKDGNVTGPGGKCPVSASYRMVQACHPTNALDFSLPGGSEVFSTVSGTISSIRTPEDLTNEGFLSETGCFDGGFVIDIVSDNGIRHGFWHLQFDNNSFSHFSVNGKELKVGDKVREGQPIGWIWDGAVGSPTLDTCYQNPGGRSGLYEGMGIATGTWWTGPHLHFAIYTGTPPCKAVINFVDENCHPATNTWDHSYNY